jgi:hypothetical protein
MGLFEDVVKNVQSTVSKLQNTSQEVVQTVSINSRINSLEAKKTASFTNIGRLVYDKYAKGDEVSDDLLKEKVKEIEEIHKEIDVLKADLAGMKAQHDPDVPRSAKADSKAGYTPTPGFECSQCHAPAARDKHFCVYCGNSLGDEPEGKSSEKSSNGSAGNGDSGSDKAAD